MKKVLFVATVVGHINAFHIPYLKWFKEQGWETHVAAYAENEQERHIDHCDIFHEICFTRSPFTFNNVKAYVALKKLIDVNDFDIIHCHTPVGGALARLAARDIRGKGHTKVIYTAHGFHFYKGAPLLNWLVYYPIEKFMSRYTNVLVTINKEDYARAKRKFYTQVVYYIPGIGVDIKKFTGCKVSKHDKRVELGIPDDAFVLLSVGELANRKNQRVVIEALGKIKDPTFYYVIAGRGPLKNEYAKLAEKLGIEKNLLLLGSRTDIAELCRAADVFVHPSVREGLGIAPLEAMAAGLPLISTYINGMKDYTKDGVTGCCIQDPKNVGAMCMAINKMRADKTFQSECSRNNIRIAQDYGIHNSLSRMSDIYANICDSDDYSTYVNA